MVLRGPEAVKPQIEQGLDHFREAERGRQQKAKEAEQHWAQEDRQRTKERQAGLAR